MKSGVRNQSQHIIPRNIVLAFGSSVRLTQYSTIFSAKKKPTYFERLSNDPLVLLQVGFRLSLVEFRGRLTV